VKVILLQDIKDLGKKFDVKTVKDGYARNFLLPRGLVKIATDKTIKELEIQKAAWQKQEIETKNNLEVFAKKLSEQEFKFTLKTGEKGEVFGSISKNDIKTRIYTDLNTDLHGYVENDFEISLDKPIKTLGLSQVEINLGKGVKTLIKVIIEPLSP